MRLRRGRRTGCCVGRREGDRQASRFEGLLGDGLRQFDGSVDCFSDARGVHVFPAVHLVVPRPGEIVQLALQCVAVGGELTDGPDPFVSWVPPMFAR